MELRRRIISSGAASLTAAVCCMQVEAELKRLRAELDETNRVLDLTRSEQAKVQTK